jgi:hypothetical protein
MRDHLDLARGLVHRDGAADCGKWETSGLVRDVRALSSSSVLPAQAISGSV